MTEKRRRQRGQAEAAALADAQREADEDLEAALDELRDMDDIIFADDPLEDERDGWPDYGDWMWDE
jgi:hypothetical protein